MIAWLSSPLILLYVVTGCIAFGWRALRDPTRRRSSFRQLATLVLSEACTQWRMLVWSIERRGDDLPIRGRAPVVLVHGFSATGHSLWALRRRLHADARMTFAPHLGRPGRPIADYAEKLRAALHAAVAASDEPLFVVCHSLGGVVLRTVLAQEPRLAERIARIVCVSCPLSGTRSLLPWLPLPEGRGLHAAAPELTVLAPHATITTIGTEHDVIVYPLATTQTRSAAHYTLSGIGHADLVVRERGVSLILSLLSPGGPA